jgi:hypothetical protein
MKYKNSRLSVISRKVIETFGRRIVAYVKITFPYFLSVNLG